MAANEFVGHTSNPAGRIYDCPNAGGSAAAACEEYTGAYQMSSLGFPENWITRPILVLFAFAIAFYIGAAFILRYKRVGIQISRAQQRSIDTSLGKEAMIAVSPDTKRTVKITLHDHTLDIWKRVRWLTKVETRSILKPVNTVFEPGVLNIIMGPSGSGKTSLLNAMANRLQDS
ncbi:MAG: hypothetical protein Q9212_004266, partial [Teloschistes hypoglaucus]